MKGSVVSVVLAAVFVAMTSCSNLPASQTTTPASESVTLLPAPTFTRQPTISPTFLPTATFTPVSATPTFTPTPPTPTPTPAPPTAIPTPKTVVIELSEAELARRYKTWIKDAGLFVKEIEVKLADGKIQVSMKNVGVPMYKVEEFEMLGTYTVLNGKVKFQLEEVIPDASWVWVITPTMDDVMAGITVGTHVTEVRIVTGKMIINGLKKSS